MTLASLDECDVIYVLKTCCAPILADSIKGVCAHGISWVLLTKVPTSFDVYLRLIRSYLSNSLLRLNFSLFLKFINFRYVSVSNYCGKYLMAIILYSYIKLAHTHACNIYIYKPSHMPPKHLKTYLFDFQIKFCF